MQPRSGPDNLPFRLVLIFFILALCLGLAGYFYYSGQKQHIKRKAEDELTAVADLKVKQVISWRREQLDDAELFVASPLIAPDITAWMNTGDRRLMSHILSWMRAVRASHRYKALLLLDPLGSVLLAEPAEQSAVGPDGIRLVRETIATGKVSLSDLYQSKIVPETRCSLLVPILNRAREINRKPIAVLLIRIDPSVFLYPLIQTWPGTSASAETLLLRREKDEALLLNEARHRKNVALTFRVPLMKKPALAQLLDRGEKGIVELNDYRNVPVIAAIQPVPETPWFLVAKVDRDEIFAPASKQAIFLAAIVLALIVATGLIIFLWWRRQMSEQSRLRVASELALKSLSTRYDYLSKYANDIIVISDQNGKIIEANDRAMTAYGYTRDELLLLGVRELLPPGIREDMSATMKTIDTRTGMIFESMNQRKDGVVFPVEISTRVVDTDAGKLYLNILRDITERKEAAAALRERTAFIEAILDNLPLGLAVNRVSDGRTVYVNKEFERIYGWPKEKIASVDAFFECVYPDHAYREEIRARILADIASEDRERMRWENIAITTESGEQRRITAINIPLPDQDLMISTAQDVTRRHEAELALLESRRRFERLIESVTDYIYTVRIEDGRVVSTSHGPSCVSVTGYTTEEYEADPGLWLRMVFEEDRELVVEQSRSIIAGSPAAPFEHRLIHKDGSLHWVRNTPVPRYGRDGRLAAYDGLITDITAIKTLENQLRQAQKMEAVGQLAGGVAHDFNNILTAIIGYANLLLMKMPGEAAGRSYVEQILSSAERAGNLTRSLLTFSRKQIIELRPVNLNEVIRRVEKLLTRVIGEDIEFRTRLGGDELIILADSVQIEQVLMNLATNARDAMPNGGILQIETDVVELGEEFIRSHPYAKPGSYGLITVTDTGFGMDETIKRRIFEPFFTTKAMGKGTGLGLAMVYGIIKQHNGYIHVYSEPGRGATFKMYLPLSTSSVEVKSQLDAGVLVGGNETVLLVEDDESVRAMTKKVLEDFGYRVIEAADGEEAVRVFKENRESVELLILDIIMPKKNGKETYEEIKTIKPGIKALFTSGYTADIIEQKGFLGIGLDFIGKPSAPAVLLRKVREILDEK